MRVLISLGLCLLVSACASTPQSPASLDRKPASGQLVSKQQYVEAFAAAAPYLSAFELATKATSNSKDPKCQIHFFAERILKPANSDKYRDRNGRPDIHSCQGAGPTGYHCTIEIDDGVTGTLNTRWLTCEKRGSADHCTLGFVNSNQDEMDTVIVKASFSKNNRGETVLVSNRYECAAEKKN